MSKRALTPSRKKAGPGEPIRIFVGTDAYQLLGAKVLEASIRRRTRHPIHVQTMNDLDLPAPKDRRNRSRTGFTFARFAIPELCDYRGRAIYLDADMLVFRDIEELWTWPMPSGVKLLYTQNPPDSGRRPQFSVLLLDCGRLPWKVADLVRKLDAGVYTYETLVHEFALLDESQKKAALPFEWNSLEYFKPGKTALIHFTDMSTQPWVSHANLNGEVWYAECRAALDEGSISPGDIAGAINDGCVSPELPDWLGRKIDGIRVDTARWTPPYARLQNSARARLGSVLARLKDQLHRVGLTGGAS